MKLTILNQGNMIKVKVKDVELEIDSTDSKKLEDVLHILADFIYTLDHGQKMLDVANRLSNFNNRNGHHPLTPEDENQETNIL
jgi:hypothetical protein